MSGSRLAPCSNISSTARPSTRSTTAGNPRHFNHNFGTNLSLWDWWFGTLYVTSSQPEPLSFGVGPKDNEHYSHLSALILRPFPVTARKLWRALPRPRGCNPLAD